jgi:hypothetical protein
VKTKLLLIPLALLVGALALAGCGGGGGDSDESKVEEVIEKSISSRSPKDCTELQTQKFDEQSAQVEGKGAIKACEEQAGEGEEPESTTVSGIEVDGETATAEVAVEGSDFGGQTLEVALVKDGDDWKLDQITGFAKLDQKALAEDFEKTFAEEEDSVPPELAACVVEGFEEASQAEVEEILLSGSSKPIEELAESCQG